MDTLTVVCLFDSKLAGKKTLRLTLPGRRTKNMCHQKNEQDERQRIQASIMEACHHPIFTLKWIEYDDLVADKTEANDQFYSADVAIVDFSDEKREKISDFMGLRAHRKMEQNILLYKIESPEHTPSDAIIVMSKVMPNYPFIYYSVTQDSIILTKEVSLSMKIKQELQGMRKQRNAFMVESFLEELREIIEEKKGDEKRIELNRMCKKLKNLTSAQPNSSQLISPEIFSLILMGYNDNKNYDSMVTLMESPAMQAPQLKAIAKDPQIYFLYAFALNRRGEQRRKDGDKEGAKSDQKRVLQMVSDIEYFGHCHPEYDIKRYKMLGLAGRIYKQWC